MVVPSSRSCLRGFPLRSHTKSGRGSSPNPRRPPYFHPRSTRSTRCPQTAIRRGTVCSKERVRIAPTLTDNRGNGAALNKLMTTKFPASALLMELACYMKKMSIRAVVEWAPREGNKEADRLANGITGPLTRLFVFQSVQTVSAGLYFRKRLQWDRERRVDSRS